VPLTKHSETRGGIHEKTISIRVSGFILIQIKEKFPLIYALTLLKLFGTISEEGERMSIQIK